MTAHPRGLLLSLAGAIALCAVPTAVASQQGRVIYDRSQQIDLSFLEERANRRPGARRFLEQLPSETVTRLVLTFDPSASQMEPAAEPEGENGPSTTREERQRRRFAEFARRASATRGARENTLHSFTDFTSGTVTETREFMGRNFRIEGPAPSYQWKLVGEENRFMDRLVQKAVAEQDGSTIEAWFTPEIPVPAGPGPYGGLPGLILVVSVDRGQTVYSATSIQLEGLEDLRLEPPTQGDQVTRDEYEQIVAEKLEELRDMRGQAGRRRPPR